MNFLRRLFFPPAKANTDELWLDVRCKRCGEILSARVNMRNDLSIEYSEGDGRSGYVCRKVLIGQQRCFQQVELTLRFDANRRLVEREVQGGELVEPGAA